MTDNGYHRWIHRFGISSSLLLFVAMTAFPVAISFVYGIWPDFKALWPGFVAVILFMAPYWPAETIGYMSVMGPGALYMSYITGNVTNLRMPATIGTINSLGIKPNTDECHTMAIIACGASVITTVVIVALGVVIATPLAPVLESPVIKPAFDFPCFIFSSTSSCVRPFIVSIIFLPFIVIQMYFSPMIYYNTFFGNCLLISS